MAASGASANNPYDGAHFWDRSARKYAAAPIADLGGYETTIQRVAGLLSPTDNVLEIGCGTGTTALRLAPGTRSYLATDVSSGMIAIARDKLRDQPLPTLRFEVSTAEASVQSSGDHDAVLAFNLLHLVPSLDATLRAITLSLKPGALFISKTACIAEMNPLIRAAIPVMRALGKAPHVLVFNAEQLLTAFVRHGLVIEAIERHGTRGKDPRLFVVARRTG